MWVGGIFLTIKVIGVFMKLFFLFLIDNRYQSSDTICHVAMERRILQPLADYNPVYDTVQMCLVWVTDASPSVLLLDYLDYWFVQSTEFYCNSFDRWMCQNNRLYFKLSKICIIFAHTRSQKKQKKKEKDTGEKYRSSNYIDWWNKYY